MSMLRFLAKLVEVKAVLFLIRLIRLQVLVLTVEQVKAMAKNKPPGVCWAVATHTAAHFDELWAFFMLWMWGEHKHPGISHAVFICVVDHDNTTWQEMRALGVVVVGIGGKENPYDEHGRVDEQGDPVYTSAAELVQQGEIPGKNDEAGHREYHASPDRRGLELLNRHAFFRTLDPDPDVYIHAIGSLTDYAVKVDRSRVDDVHAAPNDVKDLWAVGEDLLRGKLTLPADLRLPDSLLPDDRNAGINFVASWVVKINLFMMWIYLARNIAFARAIKQVKRYRIEWDKIYIPGIKPPIMRAILIAPHPLADNRDIARVLRYLGADTQYIRNSLGHLFVGVKDTVYKYEDEEDMNRDLDAQHENYQGFKDLKRKRIKIELSPLGILGGFRSAEFAFYGDATNRTDAELCRNYVEGSVAVTPARKANYLLCGGSTQANQSGAGWPLTDDESLDIMRSRLTGKIVEEKSNGGARTPRERDRQEQLVQPQRDAQGRLPVISY